MLCHESSKCHSQLRGHVGHTACQVALPCTFLKGENPRTIPTKFDSIWLSSSEENGLNQSEDVTATLDGRLGIRPIFKRDHPRNICTCTKFGFIWQSGSKDVYLSSK